MRSESGKVKEREMTLGAIGSGVGEGEDGRSVSVASAEGFSIDVCG